MKKKILSLITLVFIIMTFMSFNVNAAGTIHYFVALDGNDANDGSINAPFATIEGARNAIRSLGSYPSGGVVVNIRGGEYPISKKINFGFQDSGTKEAPVVYRAYNGEEVRLSGKKKLDNSKFTSVTNASILNKIPKEARGKVVEMDLSYTGDNMGDLAILGTEYSEGYKDGYTQTELIVNDKMMQLSRYPNKGKYLYTTAADNTEVSTVELSDPILAAIKDEKNLWATCWFSNYYFNNTALIAEVTPTSLKFTKKYNAKPNHPIYLMNSPSFIDTPGEYYIDREKKILYYYPVSDYKTEKVEITSATGSFFSFNNVKNMIFHDLIIEGGRASIGGATDCENIIFDSCILRNFGGGAIDFWKSKDCMVSNGEIYDFGVKMFNITGGNKSTLEDGNFRIVNNIIHNTGRNNSSYQGIWWCHDSVHDGTVGLKVMHNKIYDIPSFMGMTATGSILEYNDISRCSYEAADMGAFYSASVTRPGITLKYNYFHDITLDFECQTGYATNAIYFDGNGYGTVYGNVVTNVERNMFYSSAWGNNVVKNNVFVGNPNARTYSEFPNSTQSIRVAGYDATMTPDKYLEKIGKDASFVLSETSPWAEQYPYILRDYNEGKPLRDSQIIENNLMYNCGPMKLSDTSLSDQYTSIKNNWETTKDPGFVDAKNGNYQLKADAEVFTKIPGFEMIDMSKIGLLPEKYDIGYNIPEYSASSSKISNAVVLQVNSPKAIANDKDTFIDVNNMEIAPLIIDSRTLVPARFISESFGGKVGWNNDTRQVAVVAGGKTVIMQIDNSAYTIDGVEYTMDVPPQIIGGRTLVPLRAMCEALGKKVFWDNKGLIVISDTDNILNSEADSTYIDELISRTR